MIELPELPPGSMLRVRTAGGRVTVWWRFRPRGTVAGLGDVFLATALLAGGGLAYFALALHVESSRPDWRPTAAMLLVAGIVLGLGWLVFRKFHLPRPERVRLAAHELIYNFPGDPAADSASAFSACPEVHIPRGRIGTVQVASFGGIPALRLEIDGAFVWMGLRLSETDLDWLAEVVCRWRGAPA